MVASEGSGMCQHLKFDEFFIAHVLHDLDPLRRQHVMIEILISSSFMFGESSTQNTLLTT
jgi:hypothetical protein